MQDSIADAADRLALLSPRGQTIRAEQFTWNNNTYRRRLLGNADLREAMIDRLREIRRVTSLTETVLKQMYLADDLRKACVVAPPPHVDPESLKCEVVEAEQLGNGMFFQRQSWEPETGTRDGVFPPTTGVLVFERAEKDGAFQLVAWDVEESNSAGVPHLVTNPTAGDFLQLPMITNGTSREDLGIVLHRDAPDRAWTEFNASGWSSALDRRVPTGFIAKSAYDLDLATLVATVTLARNSDANCCPTGGTGKIRLAVRGNQLIIDAIDWAITSPGKRATPVH